MKHFKFILPVIFIIFSCSNDSDDRVQSTQLELTVLNEVDVALEGVEVKLYSSEVDYNNNNNEVETLLTDVNGKVVFDNLQSITYYWRTNFSCHSENNNYNSIIPITNNTLNQFSCNINSTFIGDLNIENNSLYSYNVQYTGPESGSLILAPGSSYTISDITSGVYTFTFESIGSPFPVSLQQTITIECGNTAFLTIN